MINRSSLKFYHFLQDQHIKQVDKGAEASVQTLLVAERLAFAAATTVQCKVQRPYIYID
jgi:hypothetical protein